MKKKLSYRDKLIELAYIYNVKEIQDYVKNCIICQKMRPLKDTRDLPIRQIPKDLIPRPIGQTIEVDLCHMPTSKEGYETICVMVDIPSKFMFLIPQRNKEAITTAANQLDENQVFQEREKNTFI